MPTTAVHVNVTTMPFHVDTTRPWIPFQTIIILVVVESVITVCTTLREDSVRLVLQTFIDPLGKACMMLMYVHSVTVFYQEFRICRQIVKRLVC